LTRVIEKRRSLHNLLASKQQQNEHLQSQIARLQALSNIGTATCMIAHEINNLLTPLTNYAALALKNPEDKALAEKVFQKTSRNCERASKTMRSILAMANGETQQRKQVRLNTLIQDIFDCLCRDFSKDGITAKIEIPEDLTVWCVPVQIQQLLMNLIFNARDAMLGRGGILTIKAVDTTDTVRIVVTDTGCGIEPANLSNIFEPFYTTKAADKLASEHPGSGLGLAFCKKVIESHGGSISVESDPGSGTSFTITLPRRGPR
jgi:signal transduction histidine kinase